jgi:hypothetical protein
MGLVLAGALVGVAVLAMALAGTKMAREVLILILVSMVGGLLAIWWFL